MNAQHQSLFLAINLDQQAPPWLVAAARFISVHMTEWMLALALLAIVLGRGGWRPQGWRILLSMALALVIAYPLKDGLALPRPVALELGVQWLSRSAVGSFPSAHAALGMAFGLSAALGPAPALLRLLFLVAAVVLGWSRIAVGVHFPLDIVAGWTLGALCAWTVELAPLPRLARAAARAVGRRSPPPAP